MRHALSTLSLLLALPVLAWGQSALVVNGNRVHAGWINYGTTTGTATAYTLFFMPPMPGYAVGQCFLLKPHVTNTGAATLNVQSKGARPITKRSGASSAPLVAGDLLVGRLVQVCYDGSELQLMGAVPDAAGPGGVTDGDKTDITVSGSGTIWTIDNSAITYTKIQNITPARLLGRVTASPGPIEELTAAQVKTMLGVTFGDILGDLPYAKLTPATAAPRLLGRGGTTPGDWQELTLGPGLAVSGTTLNTVDATTAGVVCDGATMVSAAIQTLLDTVPLGTKIVLPAGSCMLNSTLTIARSLALQGAGMDHTYLKQTITDIPTLRVTSINVHVTGMTIMHTGTPIAGGDGLVVRSETGYSLQAVGITDVSASWNYRGFVLGCMVYGHVSHAWAHANNSHGFEFLYEPDPGCGVDQWEIFQVLSQVNGGAGFWGYNELYPFGLGPWLVETQTFANAQGGYVFRGTPGHPINNLRFIAPVSSTDNVAGIYLDTYGSHHVMSEPWIELVGVQGYPVGTEMTTFTPSHTGHCLGLGVNNGPVVITGGIYWSCSWSGLALYAAHTTLTGGGIIANGQALSADPAQRAGVAIGANGVSVSGVTFSNPGTWMTSYIHLAGTLDNIAIGINSYANELTPANFVANQATVTGVRMPALVAGVAIHSNTPGAAGLHLYDATGGPSPLKLLRVTSGQLQILNATGSALLQGLTDAGTPMWPQRRGQATVVDGNVSTNVALSGGEPDAGYLVQHSVSGTAGGPAAGALTVVTINKLTTGFELIVSAPPGVGKSVTFDWLVYR